MDFRTVPASDIHQAEAFNPIGAEHWLSEFYSGKRPVSCLFACTDKDKIIGTEGYVGYYLVKNGEKLLSHRSERTLVDSNYRGKGIFEQLITNCDQLVTPAGSQFVWGATAALKPFVRAGFHSFTGFRTYAFYPVKKNLVSKISFGLRHLQILNPFSIYRIKKNKDLAAAKKLLSFLSVFKPIKRTKNNIELQASNASEIANYLINTATNDYRLYIDDSLMHWLEEKNKHYHILKVVENKKMKGYVIVRKETGHFFATIVDIIADECAIADVLQKLSAHPLFSQQSSLFFALNAENITHQSYIQNLKEHGVLHKQQAGSFVIKPLNDQAVSISQLMLTDLWLEL